MKNKVLVATTLGLVLTIVLTTIYTEQAFAAGVTGTNGGTGGNGGNGAGTNDH